MIKTYFLLAVSTHRQNIGYKNKEIDGEVATNAKKRRQSFWSKKMAWHQSESISFYELLISSKDEEV